MPSLQSYYYYSRFSVNRHLESQEKARRALFLVLYIGTCFRFYTQMRVKKQTKHLLIEFIVSSHNSVTERNKLQILACELQCMENFKNLFLAKCQPLKLCCSCLVERIVNFLGATLFFCIFADFHMSGLSEDISFVCEISLWLDHV